MSKQNPLDFETMVDQVLEAKAQKGQITKAAKQFGLRPKQIKDALASIDPSGRSSYGDWLIKMWMKGDIDPTKDADRIKEVMRAFHELKDNAYLPDEHVVLNAKRYPTFYSLLELVDMYLERLSGEFHFSAEKEDTPPDGKEFIAYHFDTYDEAEPMLSRPTWGRRFEGPTDYVPYMDRPHSRREGHWCIRNKKHWDSYMGQNDNRGFILVMKYEPRMQKKGVVGDPALAVAKAEAGGMKEVPKWISDEALRKLALNMFEDGRLVQDDLPYTGIYVLELESDGATLWTLADDGLSEESAAAHMVHFGPVSEQLDAIQASVANKSPEVKQSVVEFTSEVFIPPEAEERMVEYSDVLDGRKVNLDDLMKQRAGVNKVTRVANLRDFTQRFSEVPGVEVLGDEDDPTILVHVNVQDQGVWDYLARIATGESMAPDIEKEVMREIMLSKFINEYLNPNKPDTYFGQHAYDKFHRIEQEQGAVPGQVTIVKANKEWGQLPGIESEQKWKAIFERAMQRLGATWNFNPKDNTLTLEGATF
ncbi:MAG: hypothetical protein JRI80_17800, partial [Deltaproteobacteria bacterium]|nr:hypothetical protein [Deltaproteobacteria bacterium]